MHEVSGHQKMDGRPGGDSRGTGKPLEQRHPSNSSSADIPSASFRPRRKIGIYPSPLPYACAVKPPVDARRKAKFQ